MCKVFNQKNDPFQSRIKATNKLTYYLMLQFCFSAKHIRPNQPNLLSYRKAYFQTAIPVTKRVFMKKKSKGQPLTIISSKNELRSRRKTLQFSENLQARREMTYKNTINFRSGCNIYAQTQVIQLMADVL